MPVITLPDGSRKNFDRPVSVAEVAASIGKGLAKAALAGSVDGRSLERLTTPAMSRVLEEARTRYDLVLIDVAPTIVASDAVMLANRCDAVVLVVAGQPVRVKGAI